MLIGLGVLLLLLVAIIGYWGSCAGMGGHRVPRAPDRNRIRPCPRREGAPPVDVAGLGINLREKLRMESSSWSASSRDPSEVALKKP
jgi:hypothetical protein